MTKPKKSKEQTPLSPETPQAATHAGGRGRTSTFQILAGIVACVLLLWGLAGRYLWQDEANTAVLATRLLKTGRPLSYDGVNFVSVDDFAAEDPTSIAERTADPKAAIDYYIRRGDLRSDTTWTYQPLGQFLVAAVSLKLLGQTTLAARLPFALAALAALVVLYRLVRTCFDSAVIASIATALLIGNAYWILHGRQARYYALSSLLLMLTLASYTRWQRAQPWGATAFVIAAWLWYMVDYGTVWPVFVVLAIDALLANRGTLWRTVWPGAVLALLIAPFTFYYGLWSRASKNPAETWHSRFWFNLFNLNEYVVPTLVLVAAAALVAWRWKTLPSLERRLVAVGCGIILALAFWVPSVAPQAFLRYVIMAAPVGSLLSAWVLIRGFSLRAAPACAGAAVILLTPWVSMPLHAVKAPPPWYPHRAIFRAELSTLVSEVFLTRPDPNRLVVEWFRRNAAPTDEILINYEDLPLIFYLPNPIRGGIAAFRAEDDAKRPPDFVVLRQSVSFVHWPVFQREIARYKWTRSDLQAPDVAWGNNPDPFVQGQDFSTDRKIIVARRARDAGSAPTR